MRLSMPTKKTDSMNSLEVQLQAAFNQYQELVLKKNSLTYLKRLLTLLNT